MKYKKLLQCAVALGALVPLSAGGAGVLLGQGMLEGEGASSLSADSHYRYLSGLLLAIGIAFLTTLPNIERKTDRFQLLTGLVFIGGLARLYALLLVGVPDKAMLFGLVMELLVTPLLALFQRAVARNWNL
jgi:hypothetical protein